MKTSYLIFLLLIFNNVLLSQNDPKILFNYFDKKIGIENTELSIGSIHKNYDKTIPNSHRYFITNEYTEGQINYNNQDYYKLKLKYDIYRDLIIINSIPNDIATGIELDNNKISSFIIGDKIFKKFNLNNNNSKIELPQGIYEEVNISKNLVLYIKYTKTPRELIYGNLTKTDYNLTYQFFLKKDDVFHKIDSKKNILELFPENKKKINDYYKLYSDLEKNTKNIFLEKLFKYIFLLNK